MIFMFPYEHRGTEREREMQAEQKSDGEVKKIVRERDGYRCRDCGMALEEHKTKFGQTLEVHRLIPGVAYAADTTVTLCLDCHNKKIRRTKDAFWAKDLRWVGFNLYDPHDVALYRAIAARADNEGVCFGDMIASLLSDQIAGFLAHDLADLTLTADGL